MLCLDGTKAKCKLCPAIIKTGGGSTSGLQSHMTSQHAGVLAQEQQQVADEPPAPKKMKQPTLFQCTTGKQTSSKQKSPCKICLKI